MAAHHRGNVGRRSQFTARQKLEIVLSVLTEEARVASPYRAYGITETSSIAGRTRRSPEWMGLEGKTAASTKEAEPIKDR